MARSPRARPGLRAASRRRRRDEGGAALVEFALIAPILFLIISGIIDFAMVFNNYQALRQGVREGARQGAVMNFGSTAQCNLTGLAGNPSADIQRLMCSTKSHTGMSSNAVRVKVMFADAALTTQQSTGFGQGSALVICAQAPQTSLTGMLTPYFQNRFIKSKTVIRIEQSPTVVERDGYEQAPAGADWSWCSSPSQVSP